jgi:hypothetical protein
MPSRFMASNEPITEKNYQLPTESSLFPLTDEKNSKRIEIPMEGFKRAYIADEFDDHVMAPKKRNPDELEAEETMPNFLYNLEENDPGDLFPATKTIFENRGGRTLPAGPAGITSNYQIQSNEHQAIGISPYGILP